MAAEASVVQKILRAERKKNAGPLHGDAIWPILE
jgi:hypothetical protein